MPVEASTKPAELLRGEYRGNAMNFVLVVVEVYTTLASSLNYANERLLARRRAVRSARKRRCVVSRQRGGGEGGKEACLHKIIKRGGEEELNRN